VVGFRTLLCSEQRGGVMPLSPSFGGWWRGGGPQPPLLSMGEADAIGDCGESALSLSVDVATTATSRTRSTCASFGSYHGFSV
jgi:hypothetical protein